MVWGRWGVGWTEEGWWEVKGELEEGTGSGLDWLENDGELGQFERDEGELDQFGV